MQGYPTAYAQQPAGAPVPWTQQGGIPLAGGPQSALGAWGAPGPVGLTDWARAANSPSLGSLVPGYPGTHPLPSGPPPIRPMPGPASLGPGTAQGSLGTGGVVGVGINPVVAVPPPAATGGPHPLPTLPAMPLPEGFPNPFEMQQPGGAPGYQQGISPYAPGTTTVTGPRGYLPGLGSFGTPGQGATFGLPQPGAHPLMQAPQTPQTPQPAQQPPVPTAQPAGQTQPSPFWTALAWQLVNTPATRSTLGDRVQRLMEGDSRMRLIQLATNLLLSAEVQQAFRALSSGSMQQTTFCTLFAERLRTALETANLEQAG